MDTVLVISILKMFLAVDKVSRSCLSWSSVMGLGVSVTLLERGKIMRVVSVKVDLDEVTLGQLKKLLGQRVLQQFGGAGFEV